MRFYDAGIARFLARDMLAEAVATGKLSPEELRDKGMELPVDHLSTKEEKVTPDRHMLSGLIPRLGAPFVPGAMGKPTRRIARASAESATPGGLGETGTDLAGADRQVLRETLALGAQYVYANNAPPNYVDPLGLRAMNAKELRVYNLAIARLGVAPTLTPTVDPALKLLKAWGASPSGTAGIVIAPDAFGSVGLLMCVIVHEQAHVAGFGEFAAHMFSNCALHLMTKHSWWGWWGQTRYRPAAWAPGTACPGACPCCVAAPAGRLGAMAKTFMEWEKVFY